MTADGLLGELFLTSEGREDPYPRYAQIREIAPVHASVLGFTTLARYADCQFVLRDPRFAKGGEMTVDRSGWPEDLQKAFAEFAQRPPSLLEMNPPDHTRMRALVSKAFTPRTVERLRARVVALVDEVIDTFAVGGVTEVMDALAIPLPITVIGEMLGIPASDWSTFQPWVRAMTALLEMTVSVDELALALDANQHMEAYLVDLLAERRSRPQIDLLSELLAVEEQGDTLTESELISTVILLFGAGFETTSNLIGNGLLALLRHPDELGRLRADRGLLRSAIDELLRFDSPVQLDGRTALEDVTIDGSVVAAGSSVVTLLGAANRDPDHFGDPDRLDLARDDGPPLSFGSGIHYCLGAALARMEGQVVFDRLLERCTTWELATDAVSYRPSMVLRGLTRLPVRFG